jgi:hypothetical protein
MKTFGWRLSLLGFLCVSRIFASACAQASLSTYEALPVNIGCTIGTVVVDNFNFLVDSTSLSMANQLTAANIIVTPTFSGSVWQLNFSAAGTTSSTGFFVSSADFAKYEIDFNWDPVVIGAGDELHTNTPVFPGTATVTTKLCNGQAFGGTTCPTTASPTNTLTVFSDGKPGDEIDNATTALVPAVPLPGTPIGTSSVIDLEGGNQPGSSSYIYGFDTNVFTPEPGTLVLLAAGLLVLARRRRNKVT